MRENIPTDRLDDTPDTEPFNRTHRVQVDLAAARAARAALPQVAGVIPEAHPWYFTLELEGGKQVHVSPDLVRWAGLQPGGHGVEPMIFIAWPDLSISTYAVPDSLLAQLLPYFPASEVQS